MSSHAHTGLKPCATASRGAAPYASYYYYAAEAETD